MDNKDKPILSDFTPFNPFDSNLTSGRQPSYRQVLVIATVVLLITAVFFALVHYWR